MEQREQRKGVIITCPPKPWDILFWTGNQCQWKQNNKKTHRVIYLEGHIRCPVSGPWTRSLAPLHWSISPCVISKLVAFTLVEFIFLSPSFWLNYVLDSVHGAERSAQANHCFLSENTQWFLKFQVHNQMTGFCVYYFYFIFDFWTNDTILISHQYSKQQDRKRH